MKKIKKSFWRAYWKLHDKKKMLVARLKGYLDGLPPKTRKRIVLAMLAAFAVLALYTFMPNLIKNMPGGKIIVIIFFVAVLFAGLTSLINLYEAPIATVQEKFHLERKPACAVIAVIGVIVSILIQGIVSGWMDVLSIYICPLGAGLAGIMLFWVCGKDYVEKQVNKGRSSRFTSWFYPICKYVYVPVCILVLVLGIALGGIG